MDLTKFITTQVAFIFKVCDSKFSLGVSEPSLSISEILVVAIRTGLIFYFCILFHQKKVAIGLPKERTDI